MNVYDTVNKLAQEIKDSEEYKNFKKYKELVKSNKETDEKIKQFEELRPNSVIEVADVMTFDLARLKGYVGKLAEEQIEELDKVLETVR